MNQKIICQSVEKLGEVLESLGLGSVSKLLVFCSNRGREIIGEFLGGFHAEFYTAISPNPKFEEIQICLNAHDAKKFDALIAFGGGSVIDFAKGFKYYANAVSKGDFRETKRSAKSDLALIAIPTTAGSGSESTQFGVVYINGIKHSLDSALLLPDIAVLDSNLLLSQSPHQRATSGIDALCQSIESYFSIRSNEKSRTFAKEAMGLARDNLVAFVSKDNSKAEAMMKAANLAGRAINISRTTAAHALSYAFTTLYGVSHGHAVALSMADLMEQNLARVESFCLDPRGAEYVRGILGDILEIFGCQNALDFRNYWLNLMATLGLESNIKKLGIDPAKIITSVNKERLANNPVEIESVLDRFYKQ